MSKHTNESGVCYMCNEHINSSGYDYMPFCKKCENINYMLRKNDEEGLAGEIYPQFIISIMYKKKFCSHGGSCDNPDEKIIRYKNKIKIFPLLKLFTNDDILIDNTISPNNYLLDFYMKKIDNWCCGTIGFEIINATVKKKSDKIDLNM